MGAGIRDDSFEHIGAGRPGVPVRGLGRRRRPGRSAPPPYHRGGTHDESNATLEWDAHLAVLRSSRRPGGRFHLRARLSRGRLDGRQLGPGGTPRRGPRLPASCLIDHAARPARSCTGSARTPTSGSPPSTSTATVTACSTSSSCAASSATPLHDGHLSARPRRRPMPRDDRDRDRLARRRDRRR